MKYAEPGIKEAEMAKRIEARSEDDGNEELECSAEMLDDGVQKLLDGVFGSTDVQDETDDLKKTSKENMRSIRQPCFLEVAVMELAAVELPLEVLGQAVLPPVVRRVRGWPRRSHGSEITIKACSARCMRVGCCHTEWACAHGALAKVWRHHRSSGRAGGDCRRGVCRDIASDPSRALKLWQAACDGWPIVGMHVRAAPGGLPSAF